MWDYLESETYLYFFVAWAVEFLEPIRPTSEKADSEELVVGRRLYGDWFSEKCNGETTRHFHAFRLQILTRVFDGHLLELGIMSSGLESTEKLWAISKSISPLENAKLCLV